MFEETPVSPVLSVTEEDVGLSEGASFAVAESANAAESDRGLVIGCVSSPSVSVSRWLHQLWAQVERPMWCLYV